MPDLISLLSQLVAIDSINPDLVEGAVGENTIAEFVANWGREHGFEVHHQEVAPNRPNVILIVRGTGGGKSLMLNAHTDTVGIAGMPYAHQPRVEAGKLYGRGAYDMKGSLAACLLALLEIKQANLAGDVMVTAVCDEEYASIGTQALVKKFKADYCVITEPTEQELCIAHKGFAWFDITTYGMAAHGSRPDLGIDAIAKMGYVLTGLEALQHSLEAREKHPLLGAPSIHASLIRGGQELSSYPDKCTLQIERRTLPNESVDSAEMQLMTLIQQAAQHTENFTAEISRGVVRDAFEIAPEHPLVVAMQNAAQQVTGTSPKLVGLTFWMDSALTSAAGIPTVIYGPKGAGAHAVVEWVDLQSVSECAQVYVTLARALCG